MWPAAGTVKWSHDGLMTSALNRKIEKLRIKTNLM